MYSLVGCSAVVSYNCSLIVTSLFRKPVLVNRFSAFEISVSKALISSSVSFLYLDINRLLYDNSQQQLQGNKLTSFFLQFLVKIYLNQ